MREMRVKSKKKDGRKRKIRRTYQMVMPNEESSDRQQNLCNSGRRSSPT